MAGDKALLIQFGRIYTSVPMSVRVKPMSDPTLQEDLHFGTDVGLALTDIGTDIAADT